MLSMCFPGKPFNIRVIQVYVTMTNVQDEVKWFYKDLQDILELTPKIDVFFITEDWKAKVGSQRIPGVTGKLGLGVQDETGKG